MECKVFLLECYSHEDEGYSHVCHERQQQFHDNLKLPVVPELVEDSLDEFCLIHAVGTILQHRSKLEEIRLIGEYPGDVNNLGLDGPLKRGLVGVTLRLRFLFDTLVQLFFVEEA